MCASLWYGIFPEHMRHQIDQLQAAERALIDKLQLHLLRRIKTVCA